MYENENENENENEIDARLRRIAAARNLVSIPRETLDVIARLVEKYGEQFIANEVAEIEKLFPQSAQSAQPGDSQSKLAEFLAMAEFLKGQA